MKSKFELPIHISDVETVTDCWIFQRLAVIKTSPHWKAWMASHYNIYSTREYCFGFGEATAYAANYHDTILKRKQIRVFDLTSENVVERVKSELEAGFYVIMTLRTHPQEEHYHESIIYGFDNSKKCFLMAGLVNRDFCAVELPYEYVENTIEDVKQHFLGKPMRGMELSTQYQYPITAIKLNENFDPKNCVFEAYRKLKLEWEGGDYNLTNFFGYRFAEPGKMGISVLRTYKEMLEKIVNGEEMSEWFKGVTSASKKLLEHRIMLKYSWEYIMENWKDAITDKGKYSYELYTQAMKNVEKWVNISLKYEFTRNTELLEHIISQVDDQLESERNALHLFMDNGLDWQAFNERYI